MGLRRSPRLLPVAAAALGLLLAGCSDDGNDDASDDTATDTTLGEGVGSDLVMKGEMTCADTEGDVTTSSETQAAPPVPTPGVDVLSVDATLDDEYFTTTFHLVDPPVVESRPEYLVLVGYPEDVTGFEIQLQPREGVWVAELVQRSEQDVTNQRTALVNATVTAADDRIIATVPVAALPPISVSQPVFFGSSALLLADGELVDREGNPITITTTAAASPTTGDGTTTTSGGALVDPPPGVRAIDDCTQFGQ